MALAPRDPQGNAFGSAPRRMAAAPKASGVPDIAAWFANVDARLSNLAALEERLTGAEASVDYLEAQVKALQEGTDAPPTPPKPEPAPTPQPAPTPGAIKLTKRTTQVRATAHKQVIENLDLDVDGDAIVVDGFEDVVVRNCRIRHKNGAGIHANRAARLKTENLEITHSAPPSGNNGWGPTAGDTDKQLNMRIYNSPDFYASKLTLSDGSSGIYLINSPRARLYGIHGKNFHGGFPRGQLVQAGSSPDGILDGFDCVNEDGKSCPEDNVNMYASANWKILNGRVEGNNSWSGAGILLENGSRGCHVENVDLINMGNGGFSSYAEDCTFRNGRVYDSHNKARDGRPVASANQGKTSGLMFGAAVARIKFEQMCYRYSGSVPENVAWNTSNMPTRDIRKDQGMQPPPRRIHNHGWAS